MMTCIFSFLYPKINFQILKSFAVISHYLKQISYEEYFSLPELSTYIILSQNINWNIEIIKLEITQNYIQLGICAKATKHADINRSIIIQNNSSTTNREYSKVDILEKYREVINEYSLYLLTLLSRHTQKTGKDEYLNKLQTLEAAYYKDTSKKGIFLQLIKQIEMDRQLDKFYEETEMTESENDIVLSCWYKDHMIII